MAQFRKVLIVDDENALCELMSSIFALEGFEVATASDGSKAQKVFVDFQPDLLITDIRMPICDGLCLLAAVSHLKNPPPPVIVMSGYAGGDDKLDELNKYTNILKFFDKPLDIDEMVRFVREASERT